MIPLKKAVYTGAINNISEWESKLLYHSKHYNYVQFCKSSETCTDNYGRYDLVVGLGSQASYILPRTTGNVDPFKRVKELRNLIGGGWIMCHVNYDVKNTIEPLNSDHKSSVEFPDVIANIPKWVITRKGNTIEIYGNEVDVKQILHDIDHASINKGKSAAIKLKLPEKENYINKILTVKEHIREGRIYEMNLCQNFTAQNALPDVEGLYLRLQHYTDAPFSVFYKARDKYLLCSSPERYLQSDGSIVRSQPIKGTMKISNNITADKEALSRSIKDGAEHIMIVDLVRNDLKRNSRAGTVNVDELKGIYSFKHVHHMISTISAELMEGKDLLDAFKGSFPMGSMTGAPKIEAMKVIEELEDFKRGIYSGTIGYINPEGDADFNVVIRSILYDSSAHMISCPVGGAIVYDSDPEQEWQECLIKLKSIQNILSA